MYIYIYIYISYSLHLTFMRKPFIKERRNNLKILHSLPFTFSFNHLTMRQNKISIQIFQRFSSNQK